MRAARLSSVLAQGVPFLTASVLRPSEGLQRSELAFRATVAALALRLVQNAAPGLRPLPHMQ